MKPFISGTMKYTHTAVMKENVPHMKPCVCQSTLVKSKALKDTYDLAAKVSIALILYVRRHRCDEQRYAEAKEACNSLHLLAVP